MEDQIEQDASPAPEPEPEKKPSFWERQFSEKRTSRQYLFDFIFGFAAPILALYIDPILFTPDYSCTGGKFAGDFTLFAYSAIALGMVTLALWLVFRRWLGVLTGFVAGILLAGGVFAGAIGAALFPLSVIGLITLIGALGFIPLGTAVTYARNGFRAARQAYQRTRTLPGRIAMTASMVLGAVLVLGLPALAQWQVHTALHHATEVLVSNPGDTERAQAIEAYRQVNDVCLHLCGAMFYNEFHRIWWEDSDKYKERFNILHDVYQDVTGIDLVDCSMV